VLGNIIYNLRPTRLTTYTPLLHNTTHHHTHWGCAVTQDSKATGNSRFETEKSPRSAKNSRCLSSLIITVSAIPARFIWPAFPM